MDTAQTIKVDTFFGTKDITKNDFIKQWEDHVKQLKSIDYSMEWQEKVSVMIKNVTDTASKEFDRILNS